VQEFQPEHTYRCWICGNAVDLETCNTDEHGMAVHGDCYFVKAPAGESSRVKLRKPPHRVRDVPVSGVSCRTLGFSAS